MKRVSADTDEIAQHVGVSPQKTQSDLDKLVRLGLVLEIYSSTGAKRYCISKNGRVYLNKKRGRSNWLRLRSWVKRVVEIKP